MRANVISPTSVQYWGMLRGLNDNVKRELVVLLVNSIGTTTDTVLGAEDEKLRKQKLMSLAGSWADAPDGDEYYEMMNHRNDGRPANREIRSFDE